MSYRARQFGFFRWHLFEIGDVGENQQVSKWRFMSKNVVFLKWTCEYPILQLCSLYIFLTCDLWFDSGVKIVLSIPSLMKIHKWSILAGFANASGLGPKTLYIWIGGSSNIYDNISMLYLVRGMKMTMTAKTIKNRITMKRYKRPRLSVYHFHPQGCKKGIYSMILTLTWLPTARSFK